MNYILSVTEVNKYIRDVISKDLILSNLWVRGEVSNYKSHSSGHMYFTIKDETSILKCVMFKSYNSTLRFKPDNGIKVLVRGRVSVFERDGQYQLYAEEMQPDGIGALHLAYEQLKAKLEAEGLFSVAHKKKIPMMPANIGVVTSSTGAVIRDIINVLSRRFYNFSLKLYPVAVQGEPAARQIAHAIDKFNELCCVDVIIVARGGGSLEELWAFNEEIVARSIYKSKIPVISAVGHETDYTISDFTADMRAPTPSAAAELVMPEKYALNERIQVLNIRLFNSVKKTLSLNRARYEKLKNSMIFKQPYDRIYQERLKLDVLTRYMYKAILMNQQHVKSRLGLLVGKLDALSPLKILSRGYSIAKASETGKIIKSVEDTTIGEKIQVHVKDGQIHCKVEDINKINEDKQVGYGTEG